MFSKILVKLVDEAIVPAITLLAVRVVSAMLIARYFSIPLTVGSSGFVYRSAEDFLLINSYSVLAMVCVLAVGLLYVLLKSHLFHETHITPALSAKLFSLKLSPFIQASFDLYSQGAIWLIYSYLLFVASGIMVYFGLMYSWVFAVSLVLNVFATYLFIIDVEGELKKVDTGVEFAADEVVLTWETEEVDDGQF